MTRRLGGRADEWPGCSDMRNRLVADLHARGQKVTPEIVARLMRATHQVMLEMPSETVEEYLAEGRALGLG
jgi:hypothetical protein